MDEVFLTVIVTHKLPSHKWPSSQAAPEFTEPQGEQPARLKKKSPTYGAVSTLNITKK